MSDQQSDNPISDAIRSIDQHESIQEIQRALAQARQRLKSIPDDVARDGLFWGFFADGGATGKKWTREIFGEVELPIMAGVPLAEELTTGFHQGVLAIGVNALGFVVVTGDGADAADLTRL